MKNNCNRVVFFVHLTEPDSWVATVLIGQFLPWESSTTCGELFVKWILVLRLRQIGRVFYFFHTSLILTRTFWRHSGSGHKHRNMYIKVSPPQLPLKERLLRASRREETALVLIVCVSHGAGINTNCVQDLKQVCSLLPHSDRNLKQSLCQKSTFLLWIFLIKFKNKMKNLDW